MPTYECLTCHTTYTSGKASLFYTTKIAKCPDCQQNEADEAERKRADLEQANRSLAKAEVKVNQLLEQRHREALQAKAEKKEAEAVLRAQHKSEMDALKADEEKKRKLDVQIQQDKTEAVLRAEYRKEIAALKACEEKKIKHVQAQKDKAEAVLRAEHRKEIDILKADEEKKRKNIEANLSLKADYEKEIMRGQHEKELWETESKAERELAKMETEKAVLQKDKDLIIAKTTLEKQELALRTHKEKAVFEKQVKEKYDSAVVEKEKEIIKSEADKKKLEMELQNKLDLARTEADRQKYETDKQADLVRKKMEIAQQQFEDRKKMAESSKALIFKMEEKRLASMTEMHQMKNEFLKEIIRDSNDQVATFKELEGHFSAPKDISSKDAYEAVVNIDQAYSHTASIAAPMYKQLTAIGACDTSPPGTGGTMKTPIDDSQEQLADATNGST